MIFKGERRTIKVNITTNEVELDKTDKEIEVLLNQAKKLQDAGIEVIDGVLEQEAKDLNEIFIKNMNLNP